jgi:hypothetical protein
MNRLLLQPLKNSNHILEVDINKTAAQMLAGFYGCGMVAIFPESPFAPLALIILLAGTSRYQLNCGGNGLGFLVNGWQKK